jgi:parallel beta-helix repeat protein
MISNNSYCWGTVRIAVGITMMVLLLGNGAIAKSINDNTTGGDCISFGTWDAANKTCIMTTNINEGIQIDSNGITLDGNGHTITGNNTGYGVFLSGYTSGRTDVTIRNVKVKQFTDGILLSYSNKNNLTDNIVSNNGYGIALTSSRNNNLTNNTVSNNSEGIIFDVGPSDYSYYNNLTGNIIENNINRGISVKGFYNNLFSNKVSNNWHCPELRYLI